MTSKSYETFNKAIHSPNSAFDSAFENDTATDSSFDSSEREPYPPQTASSSSPNRSLHWLLLGLSLCCALGGMAVAAFIWLTSLPPVTDCEKVSSLSTEREQLFCAQTAAQSGDLPQLLAGIELVGQWTPDHPLYREAQQSLEDWSKSVLSIARQRHAEGDFQGALELAGRIPSISPLYKDAQVNVAEWRKQQQQGEAIHTAAQEAMKQRNWEEASRQIRALTELENDYWQFQQFNALSQRLIAEQKAWQSLLQARKLAQTNRATQISAAMMLASQIEHDTHARAAAETNLTQWGETLLKVGFQQWQVGDLETAIALGKRVSLSSTLEPEAQNLIKLSQARKLALKSVTQWKAAPGQWFHLMEAIAAARQIPPESRFHKTAQASVKHWQAQLQDVTQLQYAQLVASLEQPTALRLASHQARQVAADRPRRLQAQTLVAHWGNEIQRLEDEPYLARAQTLADQSTIAGLQAAIALAKRIPPGRLLHTEAQANIARWQSQIQVLEDRPLLGEAQQLADRGDWEAAIQVALQIPVGRALYGEAQAAIDEWQALLWNARNPRQASPEHEEEPLETATEVDPLLEPEPEAPLPLPEVPAPAAQPQPPAALPPLPATRPDMTRIEELLRRNRARSLAPEASPVPDAAPVAPEPIGERDPLPPPEAPVLPIDVAPAPSVSEEAPAPVPDVPPLVEDPVVPAEPEPVSEFVLPEVPVPQELSQAPMQAPALTAVALSPEEPPALLKVEWSSH